MWSKLYHRPYLLDTQVVSVSNIIVGISQRMSCVPHLILYPKGKFIKKNSKKWWWNFCIFFVWCKKNIEEIFANMVFDKKKSSQINHYLLNEWQTYHLSMISVIIWFDYKVRDPICVTIWKPSYLCNYIPEAYV